MARPPLLGRERGQGLAGDHPPPNRRLDRDLEHVAGDQVFQFLDHRATPRLGAVAVLLNTELTGAFLRHPLSDCGAAVSAPFAADVSAGFCAFGPPEATTTIDGRSVGIIAQCPPNPSRPDSYIGAYVAHYEDAKRAYLAYPGYGLLGLNAGYAWKRGPRQFNVALNLRRQRKRVTSDLDDPRVPEPAAEGADPAVALEQAQSYRALASALDGSAPVDAWAIHSDIMLRREPRPDASSIKVVARGGARRQEKRAREACAPNGPVLARASPGWHPRWAKAARPARA